MVFFCCCHLFVREIYTGAGILRGLCEGFCGSGVCCSLCGSGFFKGWAFCCMMGILSDFIAVGGGLMSQDLVFCHG
ncbi:MULTISPECIES: hypothetical protein [unclassified Bartonella]|uniref:hypothetical protein n=1 Tax=unclassified Bartonella TaxID=2645622 RepID=UPI0035CFD6E1